MGVKFRMLSMLRRKKLRLKKVLLLGNTFAYGCIGSNGKEFLPLQPTELRAVLSSWSKPVK